MKDVGRTKETETEQSSRKGMSQNERGLDEAYRQEMSGRGGVVRLAVRLRIGCRRRRP
jgi:hypothetical protein